MINGILLGVALASSTGVSSTVAASRVFVPAVYSFELSDDGARASDLSYGLRDERARLRDGRSALSGQPTTAARFSKTERIIAIAAGISIGWFAGGAVGYAVTPKRGPYDDTSGLKGLIIGAPIGAAVGGVTGYWLTK